MSAIMLARYIHSQKKSPKVAGSPPATKKIIADIAVPIMMVVKAEIVNIKHVATEILSLVDLVWRLMMNKGRQDVTAAIKNPPKIMPAAM